VNLVKAIEAAQRDAGVELNTFGGRGASRVLEAMPEEVRLAWVQTALPDSLLIVSPVSMIQRYAERCGITLPTEEWML
jgi:hypothetical protein